MRSRCLICGSKKLESLESMKEEVFVTGDRKAFRKKTEGISKVICKDCGLVQFFQNDAYVSAVKMVFENYDVMYSKDFQTRGQDLVNCSQLHNACDKIKSAICLSEQGNMLDIGCGCGEFLEWFGQYYPLWNLYGFDIGKQFEEEVIVKKNVKHFFNSLNKLRNSGLRFDFITINHTLSLADNASDILNTVHELLNDDGIFFILDSDFEVHPYLLFEIEAHSFFTKKYLRNAVERHLFRILDVKYEHEEKEIVIFAQKDMGVKTCHLNFYEQNKRIYDEKIDYLGRVIDIVNGYLANYNSIGILGTSIAGVWLSEVITRIILQNYVGKEIFYIDEDEDMLKKQIGVNGYPIYCFEDVKKPSIIFLPFPHYISEDIIKRCAGKYGHLTFVDFE